MKYDESRITFWAFLISLPVCYFTIVPAVVSACVYFLISVLDTQREGKKLEMELIRFEAAQKNKGPGVNLAPVWERLDKLETSLSAVNLRLGLGELPKSIK